MSKILIIGTVWPEPQSSAAGVRMIQLIKVFLNKGYEVIFASSSKHSDNSFNLRELNVIEITIKLNDSSFNDFVSHLKPSVVLFDRYMIEEQFGWRIAECVPKALRILDTEDLHCLRKGREASFKDQKLFDNSYLFRDIAKREIASIYRCDFSLIISEAEMKILLNNFKIPKFLLHYLPFLIDELTETDKNRLPDFNERKDFVTIGNFLHPPNMDSLIYLKNFIWPKIKTKLKNTKLFVYGAYASEKSMQYQDRLNGLYVKGFGDNANQILSHAKICLAPLRFGAGLKGKFFDAMINGTPFITTSIGAEGILEENMEYDFVSNNIDDLVDKAVTLYQHEEKWKQQQKMGFSILNKKFKKTDHVEAFLNKLEEAIEKREVNRLNNFIGSMLYFHTIQSTKYMSRWIEAKNK